MKNKNISQFRLLFLPLIIIAKIIRYTIQYQVQVVQAIGWDYLPKITAGDYHFVTVFDSLFSKGNHGGTAGTNVIALSQLINKIFGFTTYYEWEIFISIVFNLIIYKIVVDYYRNHCDISRMHRYFVYFNVIILNLFCLCLAKEFFQMIFWILMMYAIRNVQVQKKGYYHVFFVIFLMVLFTRKYYILISIYFVLVNYYVVNFFPHKLNRKNTGKTKMILSFVTLMVLVAGVYYVMSSVLAMENEETYEELARVNLRDSASANSILLPVFGGGSTLAMTAEFFLKIFRLMFPLELLVKFKVTFGVTIIYQIMVFLLIFNSLRNSQTNSIEKNFATYVYIGFWFMSATFEPDYGSWMRHQGVVFPVMLYMLGTSNYKNKKRMYA